MNYNTLKKYFLAAGAMLGIISCEDRDLVTIDNQAAPIVMDLSSESVYLDPKFAENPALTITWEAAEYTIPTEINYLVQASNESGFSEPIQMTATTASTRVANFTTQQLNEVAGKLSLAPFVESTIYIRVQSFVGNNQLLSTSNVTPLKITPYELVYPNFYLVGAASFVGWNAGSAQLLYKDGSKSVIYTYLQNGENFRFLGQQGWDGFNYALTTEGTKDENKYFLQWSDNLSKPDGDNENIRFSGESGIYKIVIDAKDKVQTLEAKASAIPGFDFANLYIVGSVAGNGWDAGNAIAMTKTGTGEFEFTTNLSTGDAFKLLGQKDWAALEWGNIFGTEGNSGYLGPKGDNSNIVFDGANGTYKISVNLKAGIYKITPQ